MVATQPGPERAVVEAHGRVHVVGDEREVVDPPPVGGGRLGGLGHVVHAASPWSEGPGSPGPAALPRYRSGPQRRSPGADKRRSCSEVGTCRSSRECGAERRQRRVPGRRRRGPARRHARRPVPRPSRCSNRRAVAPPTCPSWRKSCAAVCATSAVATTPASPTSARATPRPACSATSRRPAPCSPCSKRCATRSTAGSPRPAGAGGGTVDPRPVRHRAADLRRGRHDARPTIARVQTLEVSRYGNPFGFEHDHRFLTRSALFFYMRYASRGRARELQAGRHRRAAADRTRASRRRCSSSSIRT